MANTLFEKLIGTWTLVQLLEVPVNGGPITHPMGKNPQGLIIYHPDGYMSAQIMNTEPGNLLQKNFTNAASEKHSREASGYLAYSGPFETDEEKQIVNHTMSISLFPNWRGQTQNRLVAFKDGFLHLENEKPFKNNSRLVTHQLTWKKICN